MGNFEFNPNAYGNERMSYTSGVRNGDNFEQNLTNANWHDTLNMKFTSKIFSPESPFFHKLGELWDLEA